MSIDYADIKAQADAVVALAGKTMALRPGPSDADVYDETQGSDDYDANDDSNDVDITGVLLDFSDRERDGTVVLVGDRKALIAVGELTSMPKPGDFIVDGEKRWRVIQASEVNPAGTPLLYKAQVRA